MFRAGPVSFAVILLTGCSGASPSAGVPPDSAATASPTAPDSPGVTSPGAPSAQAPSTTAPAARRVCGSPTQHVYHVYRLQLIDACRTVSGVVAGVRSEMDGDYHVRLTLDPAFSSMLRPANGTYQHGDLILEPICQHEVTQADAVAPCAGGVAQVPIPPIGTHVSATGSYVLDQQHSGWAELHPLFEIHPG